jgi:hypothetical protein
MIAGRGKGRPVFLLFRQLAAHRCHTLCSHVTPLLLEAGYQVRLPIIQAPNVIR